MSKLKVINNTKEQIYLLQPTASYLFRLLSFFNSTLLKERCRLFFFKTLVI